MPLYDYDCAACGRRFETIHGVYGDPPQDCPLCGSGPVRKALSAPAVHFKGSGWAKKERRAPSASKDATASSDSVSGSQAGSADSSEGSTAPAETKTADAAVPTAPASASKSDD